MHYSSAGEGNKQELCFVPPAIGQSIIGRDFLGVTPRDFFFGGGEVCKNVFHLLHSTKLALDIQTSQYKHNNGRALLLC